MPDLASIAAALTSIKAATEIVKTIRESEASIQKAELKLRLADILTALADARTELTDVQELLVRRDRRIAELEEAFAAKDRLKRRYDAYYRLNANGEPEGEPLCVRCWEVDHRQHQLVCDTADHRSQRCPACNQKFERRRAVYIQARVADGS